MLDAALQTALIRRRRGLAGLPLPAAAWEYFSGEYATPAKATGLLRGIEVPGVNTPTVAPDGSLFAGRPAMQASVAGNRQWYYTTYPGSPFFATGTRPFIYAVGRWRVQPTGAQQTLCGIGDHSTAWRLDVVALATSGTLRGRFGRSSWAVENDDGVADTGLHRFAVWMDGTHRNFRLDDTKFAIADTDTIGKVNGIGIGGATGAAGAETGDVSIVFFLICTSPPTVAELAALDAWAIKYYDLPANPLSVLGTKAKLWGHAGNIVLGIGTKIAQFTDLSGNGNHGVNGTFANQAAKVDSVINGKSIARFTGSGSSGQWYVVNPFTALAQGSFPELWLVYKQLSTNPVFGGTFNISNGATMTLQQGGSATYKNFDVGPGARTQFIDASDDTFELLRLYTSPSHRVDRNGVLLATGAHTAGVTASTQVILGNLGVSGSFAFNGDIRELLVIDQPVTSGEKSSLLSYFRTQYPSLSIP